MVRNFDARASKAFEDYAAAARQAQRTLKIGDGIRAGRLWSRYLAIAALQWADDPKVTRLGRDRRKRNMRRPES